MVTDFDALDSRAVARLSSEPMRHPSIKLFTRSIASKMFISVSLSMFSASFVSSAGSGYTRP